MVTVSTYPVASPADMESANSLLMQLLHDPSDYEPVSFETLQQIVSEPNTITVIARDGEKIVGFGLLFIIHKVRGKYGYVEDMIVDSTYRGQGIGQKILTELISTARSKGVKTVELSTRPSRVAANKLYEKAGFVQKETNVYRLKL